MTTLVYILIIWSSLCTANDPNCETGDYVELGRYSTLDDCQQRLQAWRTVRAPTNRGICYKRRTK